MSSSVRQEIQYGANLICEEAKPSVIKLAVHLVIFAFAASCFMVMLIITSGLLALCDLLFKNYEIYVKAACVVSEVLLSLYLLGFKPSRPLVSGSQLLHPESHVKLACQNLCPYELHSTWSESFAKQSHDGVLCQNQNRSEINQ